ncbi:hypothetical protein QBC43DRAFT_341272 [Cladorrhinum sp. PSN259]|nr:hypothetical protein QBC43DRAFT_341272 [Cladorrhinum sp. PSN259]
MAELHGKVDSIGSEVSSITAALRGLLEEGRVSKSRKIKTLGTQVVQTFLGDLLTRLDKVNSNLVDVGKLTSHISPPPPVHGPDTPLSYNSPVSQPALPSDEPPPPERPLDQLQHQHRHPKRQSLEQLPIQQSDNQPQHHPEPQPEPQPQDLHRQTQADELPRQDSQQLVIYPSQEQHHPQEEPQQAHQALLSLHQASSQNQTNYISAAEEVAAQTQTSRVVDQESTKPDASSRVPIALSNGSVYLEPVIQEHASPLFDCNYKDVNNLNEELFERYSSHPVVKDRGYFKLQVRGLPPLAVHEVRRPGKHHATSFVYEVDHHGLVKVDTGKIIRFKPPRLPFPPSRKKDWTFEEQKELWNSSAARPPKGSRPYIIGNPLFEDIDLHPGEKLKQRGRTVLEGINTQYVYFNLKGKTITTMHREDAHVRSENLLRSGEHKFWCFIKPAFAAKFEDRMQLEYPEMRQCSQAVRHLSRHIPPSVLEDWGIEYTLDYCCPGQAVVTEPGTYHQVLNLGPNYALAVNVEYESSPEDPPDYRFCDNRCPDKFAMKADDFRLYEELYNEKWGGENENRGSGVRSSMTFQSSMANTEPLSQPGLMSVEKPSTSQELDPLPTSGPVQSATPPPEKSSSNICAPQQQESVPVPQSNLSGRKPETPSPAIHKPQEKQQRKQDDGSRSAAPEATSMRPPIATPAPTVAPETRTALLQRPVLYTPIPERPEPLSLSSLSSLRGLAPPPNFLSSPISCFRSPARSDQQASALPSFYSHAMPPSGLSAPLAPPMPPSRPPPTPFRKTARMLGSKRPADPSEPSPASKKPRGSNNPPLMEPHCVPKPQVMEAQHMMSVSAVNTQHRPEALMVAPPQTQLPVLEPHFVVASPMSESPSLEDSHDAERQTEKQPVMERQDICGKPAFDRLARLVEGWRGYCKATHVEPKGINLVNHVEQMPRDDPELYIFLLRFCKMRLAENFDRMAKGRKNAATKSADTMDGLLEDLGWDESQRHRLHDYLREGKCWNTLTKRFEGLLPVLSSISDAEALELALFQDQVKSFHQQLKTEFVEKLCAVGKTLQDSIWNCLELPEFVFESAYRPWFTIQQILPMLKTFSLLKEPFYDEKLPYHWGLPPARWSLFWGWPTNPVAVPQQVKWCDADGCRRRANCKCAAKLIPDVPRISINGPKGPGIRAIGVFEAGEILGELTGELVPAGMFAGLCEWTWEIRRPDIGGQVVAEIWPRERGNWVRLVPHSTTPTTEFRLKKLSGKWRTILAALEKIQDGEEITAKYGAGYYREQPYDVVEGLQ